MDHAQAGDFMAAAAAFENAQSAYPNNAYLLTLDGLGVAARWRHDHGEIFRRGGVCPPDYVWGYCQLAVARCASRLVAASEAVAAASASSPRLDRIVRLDPILTTKCPALVK